MVTFTSEKYVYKTRREFLGRFIYLRNKKQVEKKRHSVFSYDFATRTKAI